MFLDEKIIKIFRRALRMNEEDFMYVLHDYANVMLESISVAGLDYLIQKDNIDTFTPKQIEKAIDRVFKEVHKDPKMLEAIVNQMEEVNLELLDFFKKTAPPGDRLYLQVYLTTLIRQFKENKEDSKASHSLNLLKEISRTPLNSGLTTKLNLLPKK